MAAELRAHRRWISGVCTHDELRFHSIEEPALGPPVHARLVRTISLRYGAAARRHPGSTAAARLAVYRGGRDGGEYFALHPGPVRTARSDLGFDICQGLCRVPECASSRRLVAVRIAPSAADSTFTDAILEAPYRAAHLTGSAELSSHARGYMESRRPFA